MDKISFTHNIQPNITLIPNDFIDQHMCRADGEYVKIYLLLLRLMNASEYQGTEQLADMLEMTQKDILRALNYWEKEGVLSLSQEDNSSEKAPVSSLEAAASDQTAVTATVSQIPEKPELDPIQLSTSIQGTDWEQIIYMVETYLGKTLSPQDLNTLCYIENQLHFSTDLLEYLIEYCVTKGKKSFRYMESVAVNWFQEGITSVSEAKEQSIQYTDNVFAIMKAFGLGNRNPGPAELDYIMRWNHLNFSSDIIIEACNRSLLSTHQASFPYANSILEGWKKAGIRNMQDIYEIDRKFHSGKSSSKPSNNTKPSSNAFHNFEQRSYDFAELESRLIDDNSRT